MTLQGRGRLLLAIGAAFLAGGAAPPPIPYEAEFRQICGVRYLDRASQIKAESNFRADAKSFDGGEGLGQATKIWPTYIRNGWVPGDSTPYQVGPAIMGAHRYMEWLEAKLSGDWIAACGGYNAGLGNIRAAKRIAEEELGLEGRDAWLVALPRVTHANSRYTINYIANIRAYRAKYRRERGE